MGKSTKTESRFVVPGTWAGERGETARGCDVSFGGDENIVKLDSGGMTVIIQKNHWTLHFQGVNFMTYKLYLNKAVTKKKKKI